MSTLPTSPLLRIEEHEHHLVALLDSPPANVVSRELIAALYQLLLAIESQDRVRVLVIGSGNPRIFCGGSDIREIEHLHAPGAALQHKLVFQNKVLEMLRDLPLITIAAIDGAAYGGGLELACCCDFIVAGRSARFALPEAKLGLFPSSGGTFRLSRRIGTARAMEMICFGDPRNAQQMQDWGLVNRIVDVGLALDEAQAWARRLASGSGQAMVAAKRLVNQCFDRSEAELIARSLQGSAHVFASQDAREGVRAFLDKRAPSFNTSVP
ncbi:enoyl-CoA hydratase/isomerase family protein [Hydrogenophaga sp.]|uniref:enoyl-CoA hydratase/isomerase family protein n=1 Tax=Hydrogenophaga sp. TaxID=1904254 RepID=UPI002717E8A4|nr:enoyl-CoA hydratase/isomerase family protein [Hydrogenophaga sp.]MDO9435380.1 enoyl-CoA hydratase/isomerase family protein [Hydrogenophaga sp.]